MDYFIALLPILIVVGLMLVLRWGSQKAGPAGWLAGLAIAAAYFGLNWDVLWVSQAKGVLLSLNVLLILWSAIFLYNLVDQVGGIEAISCYLKSAIPNVDWLQVMMAWVLTGVVEGIAGFGLPMALVAPMLVSMGVSPIAAVTASAIGHAWAVSFGNMGVVLQTLALVVQMDPDQIAPAAAVLLGLACIGSGLAAAGVLGKLRYWGRVILLGWIMAAVQGLMALAGLYPLGSFFASITGIAVSVWVGRRRSERAAPGPMLPGLRGALIAYGILVLLMMVTTLLPPVQALLGRVVWQFSFPEVVSTYGVTTPAGPGQVFRPLLHPAAIILASAAASYGLFLRGGLGTPPIWGRAAALTWRSAGPATVGVVAMVGLSTLMEHSGMTMLLARGLAEVTGTAFPVVSPLIGMLGAFATGSNSNSNVLFGPMQKNLALILGFDPTPMIAGQTAGGSLGSMVAPAKLVVGCSTTGLEGKDGLILRRTLPIGVSLALILGGVIWLLLHL